MKPKDKFEEDRKSPLSRLVGVFLGSAVSVFGLLLLTMLELEDFSQSAFQYWTPRALVIVVVATALGLPIRDKHTSLRFAYGFFVGLALALFYIWVT